MTSEPTTEDQIRRWIDSPVARADRFADVAQATATHRAAHGCDAFESGGGLMLGVIARAVAPERILEVGTALGYSSLWLSFGAGPRARVQTIERDPQHADLAREHFDARSVTNIEVWSATTFITSNLFLGRYDPDLPGLEEGAHYREELFDPRWLTSFIDGKALTVRA